MSFSKFWKYLVHKIIKNLKEKYGLRWLRVSMAYTGFPNLRDLFNGDLSSKVMKGIVSQNFRLRKCNCNKRSKIDGNCTFAGKCKTTCCIYNINCLVCGKDYVGQTQNAAKTRTGQHCGDVIKLFGKGIKTDTFASHFAQHLKDRNPATVTINEVQNCTRSKLIWSGNPISLMKSFKTLSCQLCMRERVEIAKRWLVNPVTLINSNNEIYGGCRHNAKFHHFVVTGTDEEFSEKVKSRKRLRPIF